MFKKTLLALILTGAAASASADVQYTTPEKISSFYGFTGHSYTWGGDSFDTSLGTLVGVNFNYVVTFDGGYGEIRNTASTSKRIEGVLAYGSKVDFAIAGYDDPNAIKFAGSTNSAAYNLNATYNPEVENEYSSAQVSGLTRELSVENFVTDPLALEFFTDGDGYAINYSVMPNIYIFREDHEEEDYTLVYEPQTVSITMKRSYVYEVAEEEEVEASDVPAPFLAGFALLGLAGLRRKGL